MKSRPVVHFHLFGEVEYDRFLKLQRRLVYEATANPAARVVAVLCEHPRIITIGRHGSREQVRLSDSQLQQIELPVRWVRRDGSCVLHAPGQLAVYLITMLDALGWSAAEFRDRFLRGIQRALSELAVSTARSRWGISGRSGLLAVDGMTVHDDIARHGVYINVQAQQPDLRVIDVASGARVVERDREPMSCLLAERRQPVRMSQVRTAVVAALADALSCDQHHIHTGHAWLPNHGGERESFPRAG